MAKVWSTLTDGYSNETRTIHFINGVGWARDTVIMDQLESWFGYHVDRTTDEAPDALDTATKQEIEALCGQYNLDPTDKPKWTIVGELRTAIGAVVPSPTEFKYSYDLSRWLDEHSLD